MKHCSAQFSKRIVVLGFAIAISSLNVSRSWAQSDKVNFYSDGYQIFKNGKTSEGTVASMMFDGSTVTISYGGASNPPAVFKVFLLSGGKTIGSVIRKMLDKVPPLPDICADSLKRKCGTDLSLFWGEVYSELNSVASEKTISGGKAPSKSTSKTKSLLITHGWEWTCPKGPWQRKVFVQYMGADGTKEESFNGIDICEIVKAKPCPPPKKPATSQPSTPSKLIR